MGDERKMVAVLVCLEYFTQRWQIIYGYPCQHIPLCADESSTLWGEFFSTADVLVVTVTMTSMSPCPDVKPNVSACKGKFPCKCAFFRGLFFVGDLVST